MNNTIDLNQTVHELCAQRPELIELLQELGFTEIVKPGMLQTAGRFMTIPKGAAMRGIELGTIREALREHGYDVIGSQGRDHS